MTTTDRARSRAAVGVVLAAVLALTVGCDDEPGSPAGEPGGEPADPAGEAARPNATFDATVSFDGSAVRIDYSLTNDGDDELLVVDRLPVAAGAGLRWRSNLAYVTGQGEQGVQVSQRVFAWPDTDRVDFGQAPQVGATRLVPGDSVSAELEVPLERNQPFGDDLGYGPIELPDPVSEVVFCLGVIEPPYPPALGLTEDDGVTTLLHGNEANAAQYLFCSDPVAAD